MKHHSGFELNETAERSHNKIGIMIGDTPFFGGGGTMFHRIFIYP